MTNVRWHGAQRDLLSGDIEAKISLADLEKLSNLYGLGPLERVSGEVTILDDSCFISRVIEGNVRVEEGFKGGACFLVFAQVPRWREVPLKARDLGELEEQLPEIAAEAGIDPAEPFPFILKGRARQLVYHVLCKMGDIPHSPEEHEKAKIRYSDDHAEVTVIGFHSQKHRGIFTPKESNLHLHFVTDDHAASGHIEALGLHAMRLFLPVSRDEDGKP